MQVIWSRAAQAKSSCQCSSCIHSVVALTRRSTTAAVKRRKLTVGELFTACYSSILASAAIADARAKDNRIKDWDRAIEDVKSGKPIAELKVPGTAHKRRAVEHGSGEIHETDKESHVDEPWDHTRTKVWDRRWSSTSATQYTKLDASLKRLNTRLRNDHTPSQAILDPPTTREFIDEDVIIRQDREFEHREPRTQAHLERREEMIRNLVDQMLLGTSLFSLPNNEIMRVSGDIELQRVQMAERISKLRDGFLQYPNYRWRDDKEINKERAALHSSLVTLSAKASPTQADIDVLVAKICHNLLVSTAPPSIVTYNILISEFTRLRQHHLAQVVVDSFHNDSKFAPNERTTKLILDHYIAKKDPAGFRDTTQRMRGMRNENEISGQDADMRVKRRLVYQLASEPEVVTWAMTSKVIRRGGFLIEKVKRTPAIFESLSRGNLAAHGPATAIRIVQAAIREGQTVLSGTITRIVEHCVAKQDYKAAIKLLDAILLGWDSDSVPTAITYTPDVRYALYRLLALCGVDSTNTDRGHTLHPRLNGVALQNLLRHVQLESLSNSITYAADQLHKASVALVGPNIAKNSVPCKTPPRDNYRAFSLAGVPTAVHILEGLSQTQKRQDRSIGKRVSDCRQIRLYGIEARLAVQALWVENASEHYELNIALYDKLSERSKREYIALCMVNSKTPSSTFSKLSTLSRLEAQDQAAKTRLQPRWHSVNGLQARTKEEVAFQKLMLKTA